MSRTEYYGHSYILGDGTEHFVGSSEEPPMGWVFFSYCTEPDHGHVKARDRVTHATINPECSPAQARETFARYKLSKHPEKATTNLLEKMLSSDVKSMSCSQAEIGL